MAKGSYITLSLVRGDASRVTGEGVGTMLPVMMYVAWIWVGEATIDYIAKVVCVENDDIGSGRCRMTTTTTTSNTRARANACGYPKNNKVLRHAGQYCAARTYVNPAHYPGPIPGSYPAHGLQVAGLFAKTTLPNLQELEPIK